MAPRRSAVHRRSNIGIGQSERELAVLIKKEIGVEVEPALLRRLICDRFHLLSALCHEIHQSEGQPSP